MNVSAWRQFGTSVMWKPSMGAAMLTHCPGILCSLNGIGVISSSLGPPLRGRAHCYVASASLCTGIAENSAGLRETIGCVRGWASIGRSQCFSSAICFGAMESRRRFTSSENGADIRWVKTNGDDTSNQIAGVASPMKPCQVAVIGAGAAGLVAARELLREGHDVIVFEQTKSVGGVWVYDPEIESDDLLGLSQDRKRVHSSMYASLRTNLPREIMGYTDFPFLRRDGRDDRRFPGHAEVGAYLQDFAEFYHLLDNVQFSTSVDYVSLCKDQNKISWKVRTRRRHQTDDVKEDYFDAIVVCNGHYSQPKLAEFPGSSSWPGVQLHSHNYREPSSFTDQIVVVIGNAASGEDISREIAGVAKEVHISGRTWKPAVDFSEPIGEHGNIWCHSTIECACEDGTVKFAEGGSVSADIILHCTGYFYYYPFLDTKGEVDVDDNCVDPLYEHVFPPSLAPSLSFVGLPWKVVPFQLCELQSRWIAMALSRKIDLPSTQEMMNWVESFYAQLKASGKPKRLAHNMATTQYDYVNWLADQTGSAPIDIWKIKIYEATSRNKRANPETYRDVWPDEELQQEAIARLKELDLRCRSTLKSG